MSWINVIKLCHESIFQISTDVEGAYLYVDAGCIESFQFMGAFEIFIDRGVQSICSLESINTLEMVAVWGSNCDSVKKVVIMTSRFLSDAHRYILRCLSMHQNVHYCKIFTSLSEASHSACTESPLGPDAFREYECLLVQDFDELTRKHKGEYVIKEDVLHMSDSGHRGSCENVDMRHGESPRRKLTVSVQHFPLLMCPLSSRVFVLPAEGSIAEACLSYEQDDSLSPGLPPITNGPSCGDEALPGVTLTAHFLYDLAVKMDLKLEVFSLGSLSGNVGKIMTDMSSLYDVGRRKQSAGLLLVDRTLDLLTPCRHGDSLVDRIFSLPRRPRASLLSRMKHPRAEHGIHPLSVERRRLDLKIPLDFLYDEECTTSRSVCCLLRPVEAFLKGLNSTRSSGPDPLISAADILSGPLFASHNHEATFLLDDIMEKRTKDGAVLVREWVRKIMADESFTEEGQGLIHMLRQVCKREESLLKHKCIILIAAATIIALGDYNRTKWDAASNAEKLLTSSAGGDTSQNLAIRIYQFLSKSSQNSQESNGTLSFEDTMLLVVVGYVLAGENFPNSGSDGPFLWKEENSLKEAVVDAVLENTRSKDMKLKFTSGLTEELENMRRTRGLGDADVGISKRPSLGDFDDDDDDGWGSWGDEEDRGGDREEYGGMQLKLELRDRVDNLFRYLHRVAKGKRGSHIFRSGGFSSRGGFGCADFPEASEGFMGRLLLRLLKKQEVDGIEYHSSSMGRLLKSGFGRFGLAQTKPSIGDQNIIIVFVIGGINGVEVREAGEALSMCGREDVQLIISGTTFLAPSDMMDMLLGDSSFL